MIVTLFSYDPEKGLDCREQTSYEHFDGHCPLIALDDPCTPATILMANGLIRPDAGDIAVLFRDRMGRAHHEYDTVDFEAIKNRYIIEKNNGYHFRYTGPITNGFFEALIGAMSRVACEDLLFDGEDDDRLAVICGGHYGLEVLFKWTDGQMPIMQYGDTMAYNIECDNLNDEQEHLVFLCKMARTINLLWKSVAYSMNLYFDDERFFHANEFLKEYDNDTVLQMAIEAGIDNKVEEMLAGKKIVVPDLDQFTRSTNPPF